MNKTLSQCSICGNGVRFQCRCLDTYYSQQFQAIDWPIHRKYCIPMPLLSAIENLHIPCNKYGRTQSIQHNGKEAVQYEPNTASHTLNVNAKEWKPKCSSIVGGSTVSSKYYTFRSYDDTKLIEEMWERPSSLNKKPTTEFIVQYFSENPTTTCWVTKREHAKELEQFMHDMYLMHNYKDAQKKELKINEMYCVLFEGTHYRGVVIHSINPLEAVVWLIDIGRAVQVQVKAIKELNPISKMKNAFAFAIQFDEPREVKIGETLTNLIHARIDKVESPEVKVEETSIESTSTHLDRIAKRHNQRYIQNEKIFTYEDLKCIPLPKNTSMELYCLDYSNIKKGFISACLYDHQKIMEIDDMPDAIEEHCVELKNVQTYYCPTVYELCLVYHDEYKQWYRAECIKIINKHTFRILFTDYGSYREIGSSYIRPMDKKFMQPVIMHMCRINGMPMNASKAKVEKYTSYFEENRIFRIEYAEKYDVLGAELTKIHLSDDLL